MNLTARIISVLFHPLLMATYLFSLFGISFPIAFESISEESRWMFVALLFLCTFVLPMLVLNLLRTMKQLPTFTMEDRRERILPFILISVCYCGATAMFYHHNGVSMSQTFFRILIVINALVLVSTIITFFYKVSVHSIAIWGSIGILFLLNTMSETQALLYPIVVCIVLAGVIMSARLRLNVHTLGEVLVGGATGLLTALVMMYVLF